MAGMKYVLLGMILVAGFLAYFIFARITSRKVHDTVGRQERTADGHGRNSPRTGRDAPLPHGLDELRALFAVPGEPQPGDWLDEHHEYR